MVYLNNKIVSYSIDNKRRTRLQRWTWLFKESHENFESHSFLFVSNVCPIRMLWHDTCLHVLQQRKRECINFEQIELMQFILNVSYALNCCITDQPTRVRRLSNNAYFQLWFLDLRNKACQVWLWLEIRRNTIRSLWNSIMNSIISIAWIIATWLFISVRTLNCYEKSIICSLLSVYSISKSLF